MQDADAAPEPPTAGCPPPAERDLRLQRWAAFITGELTARRLRPGQFAAYAHVCASTVSLWQRGRALPSREAIARVAWYLRLPVAAVAERAGMVSRTPLPCLSRADADPEWRALVAQLDTLPAVQFHDVKQALRLVLHTWARRRARWSRSAGPGASADCQARCGPAHGEGGTPPRLRTRCRCRSRQPDAHRRFGTHRGTASSRTSTTQNARRGGTAAPGHLRVAGEARRQCPPAWQACDGTRSRQPVVRPDKT
jgi:hypothetical protein